MTVQQVISLAKNGELQQLAINENTDAIIGFINLGLLELYKRFTLKTDEALVHLVEGKIIYSLDGTDPDVEMGDTSLMYIVSVLGGIESGRELEELSLNDSENPYSINTVNYTDIQVPVVTEGAMLSVIYASKPTYVDATNLAAEIDIPDQLVEPLLHYIGYRGHGSVDGNIQTESNTHYMRFEASCNKAKELGVGIPADDITMETRLYTRGFV
jgi:hypothetical protein